VDEGDNKEQGAGDQGMMFGYATNETPELMPMALAFSHRLVHELSVIRKKNELAKLNGEELESFHYLRPDVKSQVTIRYDDNNKPLYVDTIVVSTQHDDWADDATMLAKIEHDIKTILIPKVIPNEMLTADTKYHINPTGKFVIGGPHGDSGLTGRKIIVDTYGGKGAHGGGAFSGKDSSKVDRSAAYAARHIAKNMVAAKLASEVLVQVAYAIGVAEPVSITVNTYGTAKVNLSDGEIAIKVAELFDMKPKAIVERFGLKNPIFSPTAAYGHMGREPEEKDIELNLVKKEEIKDENGVIIKTIETRTLTKKRVFFFPWEKLDYEDKVKEAFGL
jgi:S-adenosylmethionine synthetase